MKLLFSVLFILLSAFPNHGFASKVSLDQIRRDVGEIYKTYLSDRSGRNADYIPALDERHVDPNLFGITVVTADGYSFTYGDSKAEFSIQSISKPFTYALALQERGSEPIIKIGVNATGFPFNSILSLELKVEDRRQNPMVNAGALQAVSMIPSTPQASRWDRIQRFFGAMAGTPLSVGEQIFQSEMKTNFNNRAIALLLQKYKMLDGDPGETIEVYTKTCSLLVNSETLATMGMTLANWGQHPVSKKTLFNAEVAQNVLSVMSSSGMYEDSGRWFLDTGIPSKSGVSGGMLAVVPGELAIAVFSPRLNRVGNSVRGEAVIRELSRRWNLHLFAKPQMPRNL